MIKAIISDFSRVLLFPKDEEYLGSLNALYREHKTKNDFNFFDYYYLNQELLEVYRGYKLKLRLYILTSEQIQNDPVLAPYLEPVFDDIFSAQDLGLNKKDPQIFTLIATRLSLNPAQMLFIDDSSENLQAATKAGYKTILYENNQQASNELTKLVVS